MKKITKILTVILFAALSVQMISSTSSAADIDIIKNVSFTDISRSQIVYDDNGGYFVETLENTLPSLNSSVLSATTYNAVTTKTKTKSVKYYNSKNVLCWKYSLTASFNVKIGSSVSYKSSSASLDNQNSWSFVSEKHSGSGSKAYGTIKMKKNGTTIAKTITIQCDKNGNFS